MFARAILVAASLYGLWLAPGCGGTEKKAVVASPPPPRGRVVSNDDVSEEGKQWGGWRWKGENDQCYYLHDNHCFVSKNLACKAAGCEKSCKVEKAGAPAEVSCPTPAPPKSS